MSDIFRGAWVVAPRGFSTGQRVFSTGQRIFSTGQRVHSASLPYYVLTRSALSMPRRQRTKRKK